MQVSFVTTNMPLFIICHIYIIQFEIIWPKSLLTQAYRKHIDSRKCSFESMQQWWELQRAVLGQKVKKNLMNIFSIRNFKCLIHWKVQGKLVNSLYPKLLGLPLKLKERGGGISTFSYITLVVPIHVNKYNSVSALLHLW